jgi:hypothetical protein
LGDYLSKNKDPALIKERKVLLESFLHRCLLHPTLGKSHHLHSILKGQYSQSSYTKPASSSSSGTLKPLKKPDTQFASAQDYTVRFTAQLAHIAKLQARIETGLKGYSVTLTELGLHFNGWSLSENELAAPIETTGLLF